MIAITVTTKTRCRSVTIHFTIYIYMCTNREQHLPKTDVVTNIHLLISNRRVKPIRVRGNKYKSLTLHAAGLYSTLACETSQIQVNGLNIPTYFINRTS